MMPNARKPLPIRVRRTTASRILGLAAGLALATGLASCAAGPSFYDRGGFSDASDTWEGAAQPRPVTTSSTVTRVGSMPLLPPVPAKDDGLPPIKMTAFAD